MNTGYWPPALVLAPDGLATLIQLWCSHLVLGYLLERPALAERVGPGYPWPALLTGLGLFVGLNALLLPVGGWPGWVLPGVLLALGSWRLLAQALEQRARRIAPERALAAHLLYEAGFVILLLALLKRVDLSGCGCTDRLPLLAWLTGALLLFPAGDALVRDLLAAVRVGSALPAEEEGHRARVGRLVGWLERLLILGFALAGQLAAVGFVIAAKSMARFRALDDRHFAEQYLLGTLFSTLVALGTALLLKAVLG